jgi:hypothetical protein
VWWVSFNPLLRVLTMTVCLIPVVKVPPITVYWSYPFTVLKEPRWSALVLIGAAFDFIGRRNAD